MIYSYRGLTPPAGLLDLIRHGEVAGVIFFGGNIASTTQIAGVISQFDQAKASPDNPLRTLPLPAIIGGELRQRLGFTGVTITDALEAAALRAFGPIGQRATLAAGAGMDLILCAGQSVDEGDQARIALQQGLGNGTLDHAAFAAAVNRITALRSSLRN